MYGSDGNKILYAIVCVHRYQQNLYLRNSHLENLVKAVRHIGWVI